jgi:poly(3-hydroxybutyrate) depolymerase
MGGTKTGGAGGKGGGVGPATGGATPVGGSSGSGDAVKSAGCGATTWPTTKNNLTLTVGGQSRSYNLRIPDNYDTNHPYRLILAFHWLNGTAAAVTNGDGGTTAKPFYGLVELANNSTIFVAPQGINNGWSDTGHTQTAGGNDIKFTQALVEELENKLCVDKSRIFAEGFSMGGSMSYAVACAMGDVVRAVAVHSGGPMSGCVTHNKPVAYFMTHGTQDAVCTYPDYGVPQVNDFAKVNGCMARDMPSAPSDGGKTANCVDFMGCSAGHPTRACIFQGPHNPTPPVTGGRASSTSWVPGEVWKFFTQF